MLDRMAKRTDVVWVGQDRGSNQWYLAVLSGSIGVLVYAISVVGYFGVRDAVLVDPVQAVYPGVWFGVLIAGFVLTTPRRGVSIGGLLLSGGFVVWLFVVSGLLTFGPSGTGVTIDMVMPGWGPIVILEVIGGSLTIVPFQTAGYVGIGVFLYRAVGQSPSGVLPGVASVFSCAGCLGWIGITLIGVSGVSSAWLIEYSYPIATIAFVTTVWLFSYFSIGTEQTAP